MTVVVLWIMRAPFLPRHDPWQVTLRPPFSLLEVGGNFLLLLPLALLLAAGVARRSGGRRPQLLLWLVLFGACILIEAGQVSVRGRLISPYDLGLNLAGGSLGQWMGCRIGTESGDWARRAMVGIGGVLVLVCLGVSCFLLLRAGAVREGFQIRNWDASYPIVVGDEVGGERAYRGVVKEARICAPGPGDPLCATRGADPATRRRLVRAVEDAQSVRLEAIVRSSSSRQEGPTRIVTFSDGPDLRNATLAQSGDDLVLRIRTPAGGPNGTGVIYRLPDAVATGTETKLRAVYRDGRMRLSATTPGTVRSAEHALTSSWLWTSVVTGRIDPGHPEQRLWAGLVGMLLVVFPLGWAAGWSVARRGRGLSVATGATVGVLAFVIFAARLGTRPGPAAIFAAAGMAALGAWVAFRDRHTWWPHYTR